jgi:hypothetical protein
LQPGSIAISKGEQRRGYSVGAVASDKRRKALIALGI